MFYLQKQIAFLLLYSFDVLTFLEVAANFSKFCKLSPVSLAPRKPFLEFSGDGSTFSNHMLHIFAAGVDVKESFPSHVLYHLFDFVH